MTHSPDDLGFVSRRDEDGTWWLDHYDDAAAAHMWGSSPRGKIALSYAAFERVRERHNQLWTGGISGPLVFHPCTQEEAHEQNIAAQNFQAEQLEAEDEEDDWYDDDSSVQSYEDDAFDYEESRASVRMEMYELWKNEY